MNYRLINTTTKFFQDKLTTDRYPGSSPIRHQILHQNRCVLIQQTILGNYVNESTVVRLARYNNLVGHAYFYEIDTYFPRPLCVRYEMSTELSARR